MSFSNHFLELLDQSKTRVDGEATHNKYQKQIEITDWNWDGKHKQKTDDKLGKSGGRDTRVEPSIFTISKVPDRASIRMLQALHSGEIFSKATFTMFEELQGQREMTGGGFHLVVVLTDVRIIKGSLDASDSEKETTMEESWDLDYRTILFKYDRGAIQVQLDRPADADTEGVKSPVDEMVQKAKTDLDKNQRKDLIDKLGRL